MGGEGRCKMVDIEDEKEPKGLVDANLIFGCRHYTQI